MYIYILYHISIYIYIWLLVSTILKNMSQLRQWVSDDIPYMDIYIYIYMEHIKAMFENQQPVIDAPQVRRIPPLEK